MAQGEDPIKIKLDKRAEKENTKPKYKKQDLTLSAPQPSRKQPAKPLSVKRTGNSSKKSGTDEVFDFSDHEMSEGEEIPKKKALVITTQDKTDMEDASEENLGGLVEVREEYTAVTGGWAVVVLLSRVLAFIGTLEEEKGKACLEVMELEVMEVEVMEVEVTEVEVTEVAVEGM